MTDRRIFFEYVLLMGQNDAIGHARKLGGLLAGMLCHVNLIPVNPTSEGQLPTHQPCRRRGVSTGVAAIRCAVDRPH